MSADAVPLPGFGGARGDVEDLASYGRAKNYGAAIVCRGAMPRGITPTDIDLMWELGRSFLFFEGKQHGYRMGTGQKLAYERLICALPPHRAVLVVGYHPPLVRCGLDSDLTDFEFAWHGDFGLEYSPLFRGEFFAELLRLYGADADAGFPLNCQAWVDELCDYGGIIR